LTSCEAFSRQGIIVFKPLESKLRANNWQVVSQWGNLLGVTAKQLDTGENLQKGLTPHSWLINESPPRSHTQSRADFLIQC
jgi:hypothetical protein